MIIKYIKIVAFSAVMVFLMSFTACAAEGEEEDLYKYSIDVNCTLNQVVVYEKDENGQYTKPYKTFVC